MTPHEKRIILSILSVFETGELPSLAAWSACAILNDGAGISYGYRQFTARSGSLAAVIERFAKLSPLAAHTNVLGDLREGRIDRSHLLEPDDARKDKDVLAAMAHLVAAAAWPEMQRAQEEIGDEMYWHPAARQAEALGLRLPLSHLVVQDIRNQMGAGGLLRLRRTGPDGEEGRGVVAWPELPPSKGGDERAWTRALCRARLGWLDRHDDAEVRRSAYRGKALVQLAEGGAWELLPPIVVLKKTVR